jgi:hypothetical protein
MLGGLDPIRLSFGLMKSGKAAVYLSPLPGLMFANVSMLSNGDRQQWRNVGLLITKPFVASCQLDS